MTSVRVLVSYMAAFEVLVVWEYMLALKVNTLGNRRLLSVTSALLHVQYLKWVCCIYRVRGVIQLTE